MVASLMVAVMLTKVNVCLQASKSFWRTSSLLTCSKVATKCTSACTPLPNGWRLRCMLLGRGQMCVLREDRVKPPAAELGRLWPWSRPQSLRSSWPRNAQHNELKHISVEYCKPGEVRDRVRSAVRPHAREIGTCTGLLAVYATLPCALHFAAQFELVRP